MLTVDCRSAIIIVRRMFIPAGDSLLWAINAYGEKINFGTYALRVCPNSVPGTPDRV